MKPEFLIMYNKLPDNKKLDLVLILGYRNCSTFVKKKKVTDKEMELIVKYFSTYTEITNTILGYVPFDRDQVTEHYHALTALIGTKHDYTDRLIEEQKRLYKQLN